MAYVYSLGISKTTQPIVLFTDIDYILHITVLFGLWKFNWDKEIGIMSFGHVDCPLTIQNATNLHLVLIFLSMF